MSWQGGNVLAVIPARGGSKSIPRKNLAELDGVSLVGLAARLALSLPWVDRAIISTDDDEIASEARRYGLAVPFMRPSELAGDQSTSVDMWCHAWIESERVFNCRFEYSILLEPTSPLRTIDDVERTMHALSESGREAAVTVSRTPAHFTPHKTLTVDASGKLGFFLPSGAQYSLRQAIPAYFHRNGLCYAIRRNTLMEKRTILDCECEAVIVERAVVNIDEELDLVLARMLAKR